MSALARSDVAMVEFYDAQALAEEHPDSFDVPQEIELTEIAAGSIVKICAAGERFWVVVSGVSDAGKIIGKVDNELKRSEEHGLSIDDEVIFERRNIYAVWRDKPE